MACPVHRIWLINYWWLVLISINSCHQLMWREPSSRLCAFLARPYYNTLTWDENLSTFHQIWFIYFVLIVNESSASATIPILGRPNARFKSLHRAKWPEVTPPWDLLQLAGHGKRDAKTRLTGPCRQLAPDCHFLAFLFAATFLGVASSA